MAVRKPAIDGEFLDTSLKEINAAQFIQALATLTAQDFDAPEPLEEEATQPEVELGDITVGQVLQVHKAEKKKVELAREPAPILNDSDILGTLRNEKKKFENEVPNLLGLRQAIVIEPGDMSVNSLPWDRLVDEIATEVVRRLGH